jgi:hypothetical protein
LTWLSIRVETGLDETLGFYGGSHFDKWDAEAGLTMMTGAPDIEEGDSGGRFHLLELCGYIPLDVPVIMFFSGLRKHGGTSPLAAPSKMAVKWGYRWFNILYPPARIMDGRSIISLGSLPGKDFFPMKPEIVDPR